MKRAASWSIHETRGEAVTMASMATTIARTQFLIQCFFVVCVCPRGD